MIRGADYSSTLQKRSNSGQIVDLLSWAISGGPAKWCDDITYAAGITVIQLFITADDLTIDAGQTLTLTALRPLIIIANSITVNGTIEASGKGCSALTATSVGKRYTGWAWPFDDLANEAVSATRNYCLCGSGGGDAATSAGGGAFKDGGAAGAAGNDCDLTDAQIKELLFNPLFNVFQIGMGGSGGSVSTGTSGAGGGLILLIAKTITVGSAGNILANGLGTSGISEGGGGGGFVGLIGDTLSVHGSATVTATGGAASGTGFDGGDGIAVQIEV